MHDIKMREMFCRPADERALLAYIMAKGANFYSVAAKIDPKDLLYDQHVTLMLVFSTLISRGVEKLDLNIVISETQNQGVMESVGGLKYIKTISDIAISNENFEIYLKSVVESITKYKLYKIMHDGLSVVAENATDGLEGVELLSRVEGDLLSLSMGPVSINEPINLNDGLAEFLEERKNNRIELSGLRTGFPILDKQIDGMIPGTLLVIAARKKMGKSAFLTSIATHVAFKERKPVLYVDTELPFIQWRTRAIAHMSGVKERDIKYGGYSAEQLRKLEQAQTLIAKGKLFHEYMPGYSVDRLMALYRKYKHKEDIGLIVFDYLKEPESSSLDAQRKEYQILGDVTTKLKDIAGQLNIPALTAVQLNRTNDIADSDRIARYADVICYWSQRTDKDIETGGEASGTYKLEIKDTRRGGATNENGIGYYFYKEQLHILEVPIDKQYFNKFNEVVNDRSSGTYDGYANQKLS